mmetsp:Transcript_32146/g.88134  ORF Transcript_32146/g.88134 Transcript_32146/m.88134 type:complete len:212 (+) Transcript_32146:751-1386(+)
MPAPSSAGGISRIPRVAAPISRRASQGRTHRSPPATSPSTRSMPQEASSRMAACSPRLLVRCRRAPRRLTSPPPRLARYRRTPDSGMRARSLRRAPPRAGELTTRVRCRMRRRAWSPPRTRSSTPPHLRPLPLCRLLHPCHPELPYRLHCRRHNHRHRCLPALLLRARLRLRRRRTTHRASIPLLRFANCTTPPRRSPARSLLAMQTAPLA